VCVCGEAWGEFELGGYVCVVRRGESLSWGCVHGCLCRRRVPTWLTQRTSSPRSLTLLSHAFPLLGSSNRRRLRSFLALQACMGMDSQDKVVM